MKFNRFWVGLVVAGAGVLTQAQAQDVNPLTRFVGVWEGDQGVDVAPAQKVTGSAGAAAVSPFFERIEIFGGSHRHQRQ